MAAFVAPVLPDDVARPTGFLHTLLSTALVAVAVLRPLYEAETETIRDFDWVYLNPAGQQLLHQPGCPTVSLRTLFPTAQADGVFGKCVRAFQTGETQRSQADGPDGYFLLVAQRYENLLVVNFTNPSDRPQPEAEEALRESRAREQQARAEAEAGRQRFYDVLQQLPAQVATYQGPDHVYNFVNSTYQRYFPGQVRLLGRSIREVLPEAAEQGVLALLDRVYQTGEPYLQREQEVWLDFTGGAMPSQQIFLNVLFHPLRDAQGRVNGVLDFTYDVTEQVRARRQLQQLNHDLEARVRERTSQLAEQQLLLSGILGQMPAAIAALSGPEHRFTFFNDDYQRIVAGRARLGASVAEAVPEAAEQGFIGILDRVYATGEPFVSRAVPTQLRNGATGQLVQHYVDLSYQRLADAQGQATGILAFVLDVTEGVRARQQAETLQAALLAVAQRKAQERQDLYQIFEQAPVAVVLLREPDHRIDYFNAAFEELFPPENWPGPLRGHQLAEVYPRLKVEGLVELLDGVYTTGEPQVVLDMPLARLYPGSPRYVTFSYQAYREQGRIVGVAAFIYDVTGQVLAAEQIRQLNQELAATNEALLASNQELLTSNARLQRTNADLDTFVYTASHDLKAPIANIEGLLAVLRDYLPGADQQPMVPRIVGMMDDAIARFQRTVGHLTDVSRLQQHPDQEVEELSLARVIEDVRLDLLPLLESTQAQLLVDVQDCPTVHFSAKSLRSIVYNLVSNAVKYRDPARLPVVRVRARCDAHYAQLQVQDNGLGLDEQQQSKLFTMFKRLHTHVEGSGVGLYMIKRLVENAGGTIAVQSEPGAGSIFTVTLPRTPRG